MSDDVGLKEDNDWEDCLATWHKEDKLNVIKLIEDGLLEIEIDPKTKQPLPIQNSSDEISCYIG